MHTFVQLTYSRVAEHISSFVASVKCRTMVY